MEVKVSVVIPVYNAEKYLRQCLDSVLGQSLREIEVICIDDGSTDASRDILREYAATDARISAIFNGSNLHAGLCRNRGLEKARGEYILFMDSDDTLFPAALERLYAEAKKLNADVIRCRAVDHDNVTGRLSHGLHNYLKRVPFFLYNRAVDFKRWYWLFPKVNVAPWGGLVRREFLLDRNIRFNDLICVNDRSFFWETVLKAKTVAFSRTELVRYRMNMSTSPVGTRIKHFDCHFRSYELIDIMTHELPQNIRRTILDGEMRDMANWFDAARNTEYRSRITEDMKSFISSMDKTAWGEQFGKNKWLTALKKGDV